MARHSNDYFRGARCVPERVLSGRDDLGAVEQPATELAAVWWHDF
jgi:hypothetical protein